MQLFAPPPVYDITSARTPLETILFPYWIREAFERNKLDYMDIVNYDRIRKILSIEDLAQLLYCNCLNDHPLFGKLLTSNSLESSWRASMSKENLQEFAAVIAPLSRSKTIADVVMDRLFNNASCPLATGETGCRVQCTNDSKIFLFIDRCESNAFEDRARVKALVSDYLKALYSLLSIREVSRYQAFNLYFDLL